MVKGVIFDMDGLMFDTERVSGIVWRETAKTLGFSITEEFISSFRGRNYLGIKKLFKKQYGQDFDYDGARAIKQQFFHGYIDRNGVPVKKGLKELLAYLTKENIPAAVATSTGRQFAEKMLGMAGVYDCFDGIVCGDEIVHGKPDPDIFLRAAQKIGVDPLNCLVLEDSEPGVLAAKAAGGYVIHVPDMVKVSEEAKAGITAQMENLLDVVGWLQNQNKE